MDFGTVKRGVTIFGQNLIFVFFHTLFLENVISVKPEKEKKKQIFVSKNDRIKPNCDQISRIIKRSFESLKSKNYGEKTLLLTTV